MLPDPHLTSVNRAFHATKEYARLYKKLVDFHPGRFRIHIRTCLMVCLKSREMLKRMILAGSRETQQYFHSIYLLLTYTKYTIIYLLHLDYTGMLYTHRYKQKYKYIYRI